MGHLYRLSFASRSALPRTGAGGTGEVAEIVRAAKHANAAAGITGAMAIHGDTVVEVIEGPQAAVEAMLEHIRRDPRHRDMRVLHRAPARERFFPGQPLALVGGNCQAADLLTDALGEAGPWSAGKGEAVAALLRDMTAGPGDLAGGLPEASVLYSLFPTALLSPHGRVLRANAPFLALFGCNRDGMVGRHRRELFLFDGRLPAQEEAWNELWAALRRGETGTLEHQVPRADGADLWLRGTWTPRLDASGELAEVVEVAADITEQTQAVAELRGQADAMGKSHGVVHFSADGTVLHANGLFLRMTGYRPEEVTGRHHRMFVEAGFARSPEYERFWAEIATGRHRTGEFKWLGNGNREMWLQVTYSPILDRQDCLLKVVAYATDITQGKLRQADFQWQVAAIHKSHAVVTFSVDGLILEANDNFLDSMGYTLEEVQGRHHRMFVEAAYAHGAEYALFWRELGRGRYQVGQYRRVHKNGDGVWLQASYNPVFDADKRLVKVVNYATVVTDETTRQAEHQGQIAAIHKAQCVISFDLDGTVVDANDNFLRAMGYTLAEVRGRHHRMFVEPEQAAEPDYARFWADLAAGRHCSGEFKRIGRNGREVWLQATYNPILDLVGRPFRIIKYATDITAEKLCQADYQGQIEAIRKSQGVVSFALDGTILEVNDVFLRVVGYTREELTGRHHRMLVEPDHAGSPEYEEFWRILRSGSYHAGLYKRVGRNGDGVWLQASYNPILDLNGQPFKIVKFATDVTSDVALSEAYEDAKRQAQHDSATSLPNRARLNAFMVSALAVPNSRLAVFCLDLDRFKTINDLHGHTAGDHVLGEVANRLRRLVSEDQLLARVGGDEFVVAAPDMADGEVEAFAQRLVDAVGLPIRGEPGELLVGASMGIALAPADGTSPDDLLRCADIALSRAKRSGWGGFSFFAATLEDRLSTYRNMVEDMRYGLGEGQFFVQYQPWFGTNERTVRSVEALVRWRHPERGLISPAEFIPVAERSGLIVELGEWVLLTACRAASGWPGIGVSVNVSPVQFGSTDVVGVAMRVLQEAALDPRRLELEITEGVLLQDAQRAHAALAGLKALGVRLAMDDFGTGYSSLSSLRTFPFDVLKIDRQFIGDMDNRENGRDVVQAILRLGRALGLSVTAEGVETAQQLAMLTADGCDEAQGFLLSRPLNAEDIAPLLSREDEPVQMLSAG